MSRKGPVRRDADPEPERTPGTQLTPPVYEANCTWCSLNTRIEGQHEAFEFARDHRDEQGSAHFVELELTDRTPRADDD